jgi:predicted TIM-barrel fold metal-dependent hydrolase
MTDLFDTYKVIDVDTHLTEPPDTWTRSFPVSLHDKVPHIERIDGVDQWMVSGERIGAPGYYSMAGFDGIMPISTPKTFDDIHPAMFDAKARLAFLDEEGVDAQILYPNVGGFGNGYFLRLGDRELVAQCVRAYNDFLTDWCSADPARLIPISAVPFWDLDLAISEIERCLDMGHKAINFCNQPQDYGQPPLASKHWDPIWKTVQDAGVPVSFHVGGGSMGTLFEDTANMGWMTNFAKVSSMIFMDNMRCMADLIFGGMCHRFPELKFVSVESGVGWLPGALETFDWQWNNGGVRDEHPEYDLTPSEYFRRQLYGCFWFEQHSALAAIDVLPDNIMFETDYPHPTCMHPGPRTAATRPREYAQKLLGGLPEDVIRKVLYETAAKVYGI